jgi:hypothetical protein
MPNAKARESQLWLWLKKAEPEFGSDLHWERIENLVGKGTPDVHGCVHCWGSRKATFTIELKTVARTRFINCGLSQEQLWWAERRAQAGGSHWLLIQVGSGAAAKRYLIPGNKICKFQFPVPEKELDLYSWSQPGGEASGMLRLIASFK